MRHPLSHRGVAITTRVGIWSAAVLTALVGCVNIWSAATPSLPARLAWLEQFLPLEVRAGGHLFAALSGFFLLALAANLLRRKRLAWWLTVGLLGVSILSHLVKGLDYEEGLLALVLLFQLLWLRPVFTAQSDRPSIVQGLRVLIGAVLFILAYGTLGFWLQERQYAAAFSFAAAIAQTLAMFFTADSGGLQPMTRFGRYFAASIYGVSFVTLLYAVWMLFRPVIFRGAASEEERQRAQAIVEQHGRSSLARFALLEDKSYYFSPSGQSVIAYVPKGRGAVALGDPIGPASDRQETILGFRTFCSRNDWHPAFYQTLPDDVSLYRSLGFRVLKIGEEAIVDLHRFTLEGKAGRNLRTAMNKFTKQGYRVQYYPPPISPELLAELQAISDDWLDSVQGAEKKFSLGWFDPDYLRDCEIAVVEDPQGTPLAFANLIPEYQLNEATIDLMRHHRGLERGVMDYLFTSLLQHCKGQGFDTFNLGLVVLSGVGADPQAPPLEKGMHYLYEHLNQFYNVQGLRTYKEKFQPRWEPRYFVYPRLAALPDVVVALVRADSGDRLQDYFGAEFFSMPLTTGLKQLSRLGPILLSLGLFALSGWAISHELRQYSLPDILSSIATIPSWALALAIALTVMNYVFLTGYDTLATYFVRHPLPYRQTALAAFISYAISNSVGFALLSGSAIRYRFYTAWGLTPGQIGQIIAFCNLSFWLGLFAIGGLVFAVEPLSVPGILHLPFDTVHPLGLIFLSSIAAYLILSRFSHRPLKLRSWVMPHLPIPLALAQITVAACDWALAAAVLYVLLPTPPGVNYGIFFGSYLLAQIAGVISNVPGGLGVFETVLLLLLSPPIPSEQLLGALLVYRAVYYLLPLGLGAGLLGLYELRQHQTINSVQSKS
ncbi:phosphatidylglycerol lysyltransferase domain-containing protein [Leptolyngbya iicbica]|uniref:phosphatidylglycerol lysyltransferase domain-containing protein n=1 Tax=Leptolyngbya iicbica TaxID=3161580 RepID=UPI001F230A7B|nr:phosphatidylglycerol lysyltransferase domain-containing protein [Leptolyngbya sp. LK]